MKARMSIMGLYDYDNTIFDNFLLPSGLDKNILIMNILAELAELEVLYPNPNIMKTIIGFWSSKEVGIWSKLVNTTNFVYNPIWNKDGIEVYTDKETRDLHNNGTITRDLQNNTTETRNLETDAKNNGVDTTNNYTFGFNEPTETASGKNDVAFGSGNNTKNTGTVGNANTDTGTIGNVVADTGTILHEYSQKAQGNIGVTTTQEMIKQEREVVKLNVTNYIIDSFKQRFCLLVY